MNRSLPGPSRAQATSASRLATLLPAFLAGLAFAIAATAGSALLLYASRGFLRATGLVVAGTIASLAAGSWVGAAGPARTRARWLAAVLSLIAAALAVLAWSLLPGLRAAGGGNAAAMLLIIALPAYATGLLLAGSTSPAGTATAGLAGGAVGVLLATAMLIPRFDPPAVFAAAATLMVLALLADWRRARGGGGEMTGRVVIVTGVGSRGQLGFTVAQQLAAAGWRVLVTGRREAVQDLAAELNGEGREVSGVRADLLEEADAKRVVAAALERYGRLDALVNLAGGLTVMHTVEDTHLEELQRELDRNLATALVMSRASLPALRASRGAIVNFASPAAFQPVASLAAYSAAKAGVVALTGALAREEKQAGVRVNAVAPGPMDTEQNRAEMGEHTAFVSRSAVADVVRFLLSPAARGISGETIRVLTPTEADR